MRYLFVSLVAALPACRSFLPEFTRFRVPSLRSSAFGPTDAVWYDAPPGPPRRPIVAGNWKLNPATLVEASDLAKLLASNIGGQEGEVPEMVVFPPFPFLHPTIKDLEGSGIKVGAQDVSLREAGAFTGEVAAGMLASLGCEYVLLGHSERRSLFDERDASVGAKAALCLAQRNLKVILCVGETLEEYESDLLASVVDLQVRKGLASLTAAQVAERVVLAYEPVWAIGTGKVATPLQAQAAHVAIRRTLASMHGAEVARAVRIQYGGSVTPESVGELMAMPDVDGALVGGASLSSDSFTRIVHGAGAAAAADAHPRPREMTARECVACRNVLGESPVWSARDGALYWVSAPEGEVWSWNLREAPYRRLFGTTLGCVALREGPEGSLVLGGESALLAVDARDSFEPRVLCQRPDRTSATRPNDGRVDRQGRLVFGMYNNYHRAGASAAENNAGMFRLGPDLNTEEILDYRFRCSNVICFPEEGDKIYFCDTPTRKIYAFDYGERLTNRRLVWTMPAALPGGPDGANVDAEGFLWVALSGAGRVVRINPLTGAVDVVVHLPVSSPTSVTFGGEHLDELFITTRGPDGGGLYRMKMPFGIVGLPEPEFKVNDDQQ